jgi:hypothetical protein
VTDIRRKMTLRVVQASKRASFFSSFWAYFRKSRLFSGRLRCVVFDTESICVNRFSYATLGCYG